MQDGHESQDRARTRKHTESEQQCSAGKHSSVAVKREGSADRFRSASRSEPKEH